MSGKRNPAIREMGRRLWADMKKYRWVPPALLVYDAAAMLCFNAFCPMVILTGLPCPGCGMTRALACVLSGRTEEALSYHPCIYLWILAGVYAVWQRYVRGRRAVGIWWIMGGIAMAMIGYHCYRMVVLFPGRPPLVLKSDNVLGTLFPAYNVLLREIWGKSVL